MLTTVLADYSAPDDVAVVIAMMLMAVFLDDWPLAHRSLFCAPTSRAA